MEDTNKKIKKILSILLVVFIVIALGFLSWGARDTIKKFFGFATAYDSVASSAVYNGWTTNSNSYAYGENIGWIDFAPAEGDVYVADNALWGYVYGENTGWISLNCGNTDNCIGGNGEGAKVDYKVINDGEGNLSGYAYGENIGWIDFGSATSTYHVVINEEGDFTGYAYGENVGWISFNSANGGSVVYKVSTNWRHQSDRPKCNNGIDDDNDGLIDYPTDKGCSSRNAISERSGSTNSQEENIIPVIKVLKPISGTQWTTGNTYQIVWSPISTTTDTFVYMTGGGYEENRLIAYASSTDSSMTYYATDEDLPKVEGVSWKIAVCTGEMVGSSIDNCGFSGDFYANSAGKKVSPIKKPDLATTSSSGSSSSTGTNNSGGQTVNLAPIQTVELPVIRLAPLAPLVELPKFGAESKSSFTFVPPIQSFLFAPLPESISSALNKFPKLKDYLASIGFSKEQDLISLNFKQIPLQPTPEPVPAGLFIVNSGENNIRTYLAADPTYRAAQLVRITAGTPISISLISTSNVVGEWDGEKIPFVTKNGKATLEFVSEDPGRYVLTTASSPLPLAIEVIEKPKTQESTTESSSEGWLSRLFGR